MATIKINTPPYWVSKQAPARQTTNVWDEVMAFAGSRAKDRDAWTRTLLLAQVIIFLPIPIILIFYYHVSFTVLAVTVSLFIANMVKGMKGPDHKAIVSVVSIGMIDFLMLLLLVV